MNLDPFWFVLGPAQHIAVVSQDMLDIVWARKETAWHQLLSRSNDWAPKFVEQANSDGQLTTAEVRRILNDTMGYRSKRPTDESLARLISLGVLRRKARGTYEVKRGGLELIPIFAESVIPFQVDRHGTTEIDERLSAVAEALVQELVEVPSTPRIEMPPAPENEQRTWYNRMYVHRRTPAYTAAMDLAGFLTFLVTYNIRKGRAWDAIEDSSPTLIKRILRKVGVRTGGNAPQDLINLGRALGVFVNGTRRSELFVHVRLAPLANRLLWALISGRISTIEDACAHAAQIQSNVAVKHGNLGSSTSWKNLADQWYSHLTSSYAEDSAPARMQGQGVVGPRPIGAFAGPIIGAAEVLPSALGDRNTPRSTKAFAPKNSVESRWTPSVVTSAVQMMEKLPPDAQVAVYPATADIASSTCTFGATLLRLPPTQSVPDVLAVTLRCKTTPEAFGVALPWFKPGVARSPQSIAGIEVLIISEFQTRAFAIDIRHRKGRIEDRRLIPIPPQIPPGIRDLQLPAILEACRTGSIPDALRGALDAAFGAGRE